MKTAVEMMGILCQVIISSIRDYCSKTNFFSLTRDANEARKTGESKELVFVKMLVNRYHFRSNDR